MHLVETRDLTYVYPGNVKGLDRVNFIAPRNARIAVIGANGYPGDSALVTKHKIKPFIHISYNKICYSSDR